MEPKGICEMTNYGNGLLILLCGTFAAAAADDPGRLFVGQDLHASGATGVWMQAPQEAGVNWLILEDGIGLMIGDNRMEARSAVVRIQDRSADGAALGRYYQARIYLEGDVSVQRGGRAKTTPMTIVEGADALAVSLDFSGQTLVTTDDRQTVSAEAFMDHPLVARAQAAFRQMQALPAVPPAAQVPAYDRPAAPQAIRPQPIQPEEVPTPVPGAEVEAPVAVPTEPPAEAPAAEPVEAEEEEEEIYQVHVTALWEPAPKIEVVSLPDGRKIATVRGRFYLWQQHPERGLLEFLADNAVLYLTGEEFQETAPGLGGNELGYGDAEAVYLQGNIVMTEAGRTTRAEEIYYDFLQQEALVVNAEFQTYLEERQIPVYITAERLRRVSESLFQAKNVRVTSSEFYFPQVSVHASRMVLVTPEQVEDHEKVIAESEAVEEAELYTGVLEDIRAKYYDFTFFRWPRIKTDLIRPDIPLSRIRLGNDSDFGTTLETRWHLYRLLGRKEPPGMESRLALDYYSDRGYGTGVESEYETKDSMGWLTAYYMRDRGEDDLGRVDFDEFGNPRRNVKPDSENRGRFTFRHREYLPYDWQLTAEISYLSDRNFLEALYRNELYTDKGQDTLIYLKRLDGNTGFSILNQVRINDFETMTEELPTVEYHMTGESFWKDRLTFYSDTQVSRLRNRFDEDRTTPNLTSGDFYTFASTRNEADLPLLLGTFKLVPFVAATYDFEDHDEFDMGLDRRVEPEDHLLLGEYGFRTATTFWAQDPAFRSEFWDVDGLRHVVTPHFEAVWYEHNDPAIEMRDTYNFGISQHWQTHRGPVGLERTVDWMRLDVDVTWVDQPVENDIGSISYGPAGFLFNDPSIPDLFRRDKRYFSLVRNSVNADYEWFVSDTFAFRSDMNYDLDSGKLQQLNVGVSRYVHPDISYYVGSRYLRPLIISIPEEDIFEQGSQALIAAITYRLSDRYTAVFSQEYNFDFGKGVRSDLTLIRQYHRLYYALSFTLDESLERSGVHFSVWPQGVDSLAIGSRKYMGLTGAIQEY